MCMTPTTPQVNHRPLVEVRNLKKYFPVRSGIFSRISAWVKAVDDVSFEVYRRETVGLVGESGCGKTTVGRAILRLIEPTAGEVSFAGQDVRKMTGAQLRQAGPQMQMIFQDPYSSLNPRMTVGATIAEPMRVQALAKKGKDLNQRVKELLERVG